MLRLHTRSSKIVKYNDRCKRLCVNPRDRDNTLRIFIKDNLALILTGIFVSVLSGCSKAAYASEKPPFDVDWACSLIKESVVKGQQKEDLSQEIEVVDPTQQTVRLEFKPVVKDWKFVQFSVLDHSGSTITEARATPPCNFISIRSLVKTADGDPAIVSFGPNLKKLGYEPQNPPFVLSDSILHRSSKPLLALVDTGVNYNLPKVQKHLALNSEGQLIGYDFWDDDNRPFDKDPRKNIFFPLHHGTSVFSVLTQNLGDLKIAIYRFPANNMCRFSNLIEHADSAGVRIINLSMGSNSAEDWECFYETAKRHVDILFVVSAGNGGFNIELNQVFPASFDLGNIVVVTSADHFGHLPRHSNYGVKSVDFMISAEQVDVYDHRGAYSTTGGSSYAAPMLAALATRFLAQNELATTRDIVKFLESRAIKKGSNLVKFGWIPDPRDDYKF